MDKNETAQLNFDEEQLQDVTGGCSICMFADSVIRTSEQQVYVHTDNVNRSIRDGNYADTMISVINRQNHIRAISLATALKEEARRTIPGPHI